VFIIFAFTSTGKQKIQAIVANYNKDKREMARGK
jgi:hypothetical protein